MAAILPVTYPALPAGVESLPLAEREALVEKYGQYVEDTVKTLEAQADDSFKPSLADLDALVESIDLAQ